MTIDYLETLRILGGVAANHPQTTGLLWQTYSLWKNNMEELQKMVSEYKATAAQAKGPLDQAGIALQLVNLHPNVSSLLKQTISMWQTRIPDLLQILGEIQTGADEAAKT